MDPERAHEPNTRLAGARRAAGLSQRDLADAVHRLCCSRDDAAPAVDANYVSKLERGVIQRPQPRYREALREVLGATTDAELGFALYPRSPDYPKREEDEVRRIEFLTAAAGIGLGAVLGDPGRWSSSEVGRLGRADVDLVRGVTVASRALRSEHGGAACATGVAAQVDWATSLLDRPMAPGVRVELSGAVGAMASMAAWGAVDGGDEAAASRYHALALLCAEAAGDRGLRAEIRKDGGLAALYRSDPRSAFVAVERAAADAGHCPPVGQVLLVAARIRALAASGCAADAERLLHTVADDLAGFGHRPAPPGAFGSYFAEATGADLRYEVALAAVDLALAAPDHRAVAVTHVEPCLTNDGLSATRRARMAAQLARVHAVSGDEDRALVMTDRALDSADRVCSRLHAIDLRRLHSALGPMRSRESVERVTRLRALVGAA